MISFLEYPKDAKSKVLAFGSRFGGSLSCNPTEGEFLIHRGTAFRVIRHDVYMPLHCGPRPRHRILVELE